jgi:hypothetical protein
MLLSFCLPGIFFKVGYIWGNAKDENLLIRCRLSKRIMSRGNSRFIGTTIIEGHMFADGWYHPYVPMHECQVFIETNGQRVLVATYFSGSEMPQVGSVLNIQGFKENPAFPDNLRVLNVDSSADRDTSTGNLIAVFSIVGEPI